jgi:hypothetical protein
MSGRCSVPRMVWEGGTHLQNPTQQTTIDHTAFPPQTTVGTDVRQTCMHFALCNVTEPRLITLVIFQSEHCTVNTRRWLMLHPNLGADSGQWLKVTWPAPVRASMLSQAPSHLSLPSTTPPAWLVQQLAPACCMPADCSKLAEVLEPAMRAVHSTARQHSPASASQPLVTPTHRL